MSNDYGVLTILKQDDAGGLQVKSKSGWIDAPPVPDSFVCNIGDMLDRMTRGLYRSTPHRVRNLSGRDRLSFPFFFEPNFNVEVKPIELDEIAVDDKQERWDKVQRSRLSRHVWGLRAEQGSQSFPSIAAIGIIGIDRLYATS